MKETTAQETTPDVYFHVGLPKTATTFLQHKVFPKLKNIRFIRKHDFKHRHKIMRKSDHHTFLLSDEHDWNMEKVLKNFSAEFPHAKIIITFRRHDKWIASKYRYYIRKSGYRKFTDFFDIEHNQGLWKIDDLYFMNYIQLVEKYFYEKPLVIFQDDLARDFYGVLDRIAGYMGATYNQEEIDTRAIKRAFNDKQLFYLRKFNRTFKFNPEKFSNRKKLKKVHIITRKYFVHSFAFFANLIPVAFTPAYEIVPNDQLPNIREYFREDWEKCREYAHS